MISFFSSSDISGTRRACIGWWKADVHPGLKLEDQGQVRSGSDLKNLGPHISRNTIDLKLKLRV